MDKKREKKILEEIITTMENELLKHRLNERLFQRGVLLDPKLQEPLGQLQRAIKGGEKTLKFYNEVLGEY